MQPDHVHLVVMMPPKKAMAERVLAVADHPELYPQAEAEIRALLDMLPDYDTCGQTGYMGMGVSNIILDGALRRLERKRKNFVADKNKACIGE